MEQTINLYQQLVNNLINAIDQNFRNQLAKETQIESRDPKWKAARQNIERYLQQIANQNVGLEPVILSDRYFLYEDVAALLIDLIWQKKEKWRESRWKCWIILLKLYNRCALLVQSISLTGT